MSRFTTIRMIAAAAMLCVACGSPAGQAQTTQQAPDVALDQMLAPIALYPDPLLAQMMMSATNSEKVTELAAWMKSNSTLKGTQLQDAAVKAGFDASYVAMVLFPQVVTYMAQNIVWTQSLGAWFTTDRNAVFASIQRLRQQAKTMGTLTSNAQQQVETKQTSAGQQVIVIEPTNPQVVYVPQYNPQVVYTQPPTTTVIVQEDDDDAEEAIAAGLIGFTAGIAIGAAMDNHYYYGPYGWHGGGYMYADAWDDYYDAREDAREDWMDHREDLADERSDRLEDRQEGRGDRTETRQEGRSERQENRPPATDAQRAQVQERAQQRQAGTSTQSTSTQRSRTGSADARGYSSGSARTQSTTQRSSDAFSGYSNGSSQRASSSRGQQSRSSSASRASRGGGGRRR